MPDGSINVKITAQASGFVGGVNQSTTALTSLGTSAQTQTAALNSLTGVLGQSTQASTGLAAAVNQSTTAHSAHAGAVQQATQAHSAHASAVHNAAGAHAGLAHQIEEATEHLQGMLSPITGVVGGMKEMGEVLLAAFAVEKIVEFVKEIGELAEKTENTAAAIGVSAEKFSLMSSSMALVGGNADTASRAMILLQTKLVEGIENPASKAREAFLAMGISLEQMKAGMNDLPGLLSLMADGFVRMGEGAGRTAAFRDLLGRMFQQLVPYLKEGAEGIAKFNEAAEETRAPLSEDEIARLSELGRAFNRLGQDLLALHERLVLAFAGPLQSLVTAVSEAAEKTTELLGPLRSVVTAGGELVDALSRVGSAFESADEKEGAFKGTLDDLKDPLEFIKNTLNEIADIEDTLADATNTATGAWARFSKEMDAAKGPADRARAMYRLFFEPVQVPPHAPRAEYGAPIGPPIPKDYKPPVPTGPFGGEGERTREHEAGPVNDAQERKRLEEAIKKSTDALKEYNAEAERDKTIAKGNNDDAEIERIEQRKNAKLKESIAERQKLVDDAAKAATARGNPELGEEYKQLGAGLKTEDLDAQRQQEQLKQQINERAYRDFAANEKKKVVEAKNDAAAILAIYKDWAAQAATVYHQPAPVITGIETEGIKASQAAQQKNFNQSREETSAARTAADERIAINKSENDIKVALHQESKAQAIAAEQQFTEVVLAEVAKRAEAELAAASTDEQRIKAYQDIARADETLAEKIIADQAKITEAVAKQNEKQVAIIKEGFDQIGKGAETAFQGLIDGQQTVTQTMHVAANGVVFYTHHVQSAWTTLSQNLLKAAGNAASGMALKFADQFAAKGLASLLHQDVAEGETPTISGVLSKAIGGLLGLDTKPPKTELAKAGEAQQKAADAQQKAAELRAKSDQQFAEAVDKFAGKGGAAGSGAGAGTGGQAGPSETAAGYSAGQGPLPGSAATQSQMYQWLQAHGYSPTASAAIIGNAAAESSLRTDAVGKANELGLFQWNPAVGRRQGLEAYAASSGRSPTDFNVQMEYMDQELQKLDPAFKTAGDSAGQLAQRFEKGFEAPKSLADAPRRAGYAEQVYAAQTGGGPVPVVVVADHTAPQRSPSQTAAEHAANPASGLPTSTTPSEASVDAANQLKQAADALKAAAAAQQAKSEGTGATASASAPIPPLQEGGTVTSTGLALVHAGEIVLPPGTAIAGTGDLPAGEEAGAADASRMMQPAIGAIGEAIAEQAREFGQAGANLGRAGLEAHADFMSGKEAEGPLLGFKPESGEITGRLPALAEQITSAMAGPVALPEVHVAERMEGVLERAHQAEKSAGTVSTGLRLAKIPVGRAIGGVRGLDEAASSEEGAQGAAGDEHGIDLIAAAGDKLKSVAGGLVDHPAPSATELASALGAQAGAVPLSVDLEQIAGGALSSPATTSGGGLPVSSAAPPSAAAQAPAVPIPAAPAPELATGLSAPNASPNGEEFSSQLASLGPQLQTDATNTQANTTAVQAGSTAADAGTAAAKASTTAVGDNTTASKALTQALNNFQGKAGGGGSVGNTGSGEASGSGSSTNSSSQGGEWSSADVPVYADGGPVAQTGLALVHAGELIIPAGTASSPGFLQRLLAMFGLGSSGAKSRATNPALTSPAPLGNPKNPGGWDGTRYYTGETLGGARYDYSAGQGSGWQSGSNFYPNPGIRTLTDADAPDLSNPNTFPPGHFDDLKRMSPAQYASFSAADNAVAAREYGDSQQYQGIGVGVPDLFSGEGPGAGQMPEGSLSSAAGGMVVGDTDSGHWVSDSPMAGYANPLHPIAQMIAGFFGQPMGDQYRGLTGAADPTDPDDPRRTPNWSSAADDSGGDWSSDDTADVAAADSFAPSLELGGVLPSALGGMVVSGGPQTVETLGDHGNDVGTPSTYGNILFPTPPPIVQPTIPKPTTPWALLLGLLGSVGLLGLLSKLTDKKEPSADKLLAAPNTTDGTATSSATPLAGDKLSGLSDSEISGLPDSVSGLGSSSAGSAMDGAVIPSAAGGMKVDDGKGGTIAIVHPNEMILPANLSKGIQGIINSGAGDMGGVPSADAGMVVGSGAGTDGASSSGKMALDTAPLNASLAELQQSNATTRAASDQLRTGVVSNTAGDQSNTASNQANTTALDALTTKMGQSAPSGPGLGGAPGTAPVTPLTPAQSEALSAVQNRGSNYVTQVGYSGPVSESGQALPADQAFVDANYRGGQVEVSGPVGARTPAGGYDISVQNQASGEGDFSGGISRQDAGGAIASSYSDLGISTAANNNATLANTTATQSLTSAIGSSGGRGAGGGASSGGTDNSLSSAGGAVGGGLSSIGGLVGGPTGQAISAIGKVISALSGLPKFFQGISTLFSGGTKAIGGILGGGASAAGGAASLAPVTSAITAGTAAQTAAITAGTVSNVGVTTAGTGAVTAGTALNQVVTGLTTAATTAGDQEIVTALAIETAVPKPLGLAVGSWNIPGDMVAQIHKGEMIIPADYADRLRAGGGSLGQALGMMVGRKLPHFELGAYEIAHDMAGFLHRGEQVIPANYADGLRAAGGSKGSGEVNLHYSPNITHNAPVNLQGLLDREHQSMLGWINAQMRSGALRPPPG
jgi:hypothetical protein